MTKGFYNLTSGVLSQGRRLDVIANNMTNLATAGYKAETSPTTSAMAPKADKGKGVKSAEAQRLAALRKERAIFSP